jgi:endonuclease/exonuclease/phosphatase family metal-dependent hydrolase
MSPPKLKVLSHNVKMLPGPFGGGDVDLVRARALVKRFGSAYDVVALQEVFDEDARDVFDVAFKARGYVTVPKVDDKDFLHEDSGLFFASKLPIEGWGFREFAESAGSDAFADKGVFGARLRLGSRHVVVLNTHLQSSIEEDLVRRAQLIQLRRFVARLFDVFDPARHAVIAVGDFNVVGETEEYQRMLGHLTYPRDAYRVRNGDPGFTWDRTQNENMIPDDDDDQQRLDYVFVWDRVPEGGKSSGKALSPVTVLASSVVKYGTVKTRLSDHFGVDATLSLPGL